jgi:hypothetical protein
VKEPETFYYCDSPMYLAGRDRKATFAARFGVQVSIDQFCRRAARTREHLIRRADGGVGLTDNQVFACAWCNHRRGRAKVSDHRDAMQRLKAAGLHRVANGFVGSTREIRAALGLDPKPRVWPRDRREEKGVSV